MDIKLSAENQREKSSVTRIQIKIHFNLQLFSFLKKFIYF